MAHQISFEEMIDFTNEFETKLVVFKTQQKLTQQWPKEHFEKLNNLLRDLRGNICELLLVLSDKNCEVQVRNQDNSCRDRNNTDSGISRCSDASTPDKGRSSTISNQSTDSGRESMTSGVRESRELSMTIESDEIADPDPSTKPVTEIPTLSMPSNEVNDSFDINLYSTFQASENIERKKPSEHEDCTICDECQKAQRKFEKSGNNNTVCSICRTNSPFDSSDSDSEPRVESVGVQTESYIDLDSHDGSPELLDTESENYLDIHDGSSELLDTASENKNESNI